MQNSHLNNGRVGAVLVALVVLLTSSMASAATDAVVALGWKVRGFGIGTYATAQQAGTAGDFAIATVKSTLTTPAVMWAPDQFTSLKAGTFGPYTQYGYPTVISYRSAQVTDKGGSLVKSHPGAPAGVSTVMGTAVATTWCADPGSCAATHSGTLTHSPGTRKYGGAAKMLRNSQANSVGTTTIGGPYRDIFFRAYNQPGPAAQSDNYRRLYLTSTNTNPAFPTPKHQTGGFLIGATYTTGMATAMQSVLFTTTTTGTGSFALNTANQTGMISVVIPRINFNHSVSCADNFDTGGPPQTSGSPDGFCDSDGVTAVNYTGATTAGASVSFVSLTFLPEPGQLAMLGFGILSLAGLTRLRLR